MVKTMRPTDGKRARGPMTMKLNLTMGESEHKVIMEALGEAKKICETDNLTVALEMICQDWLTEKGAKPEATHLEDHIKYLEKVYPVKISFKEISKKKVKEEPEEVAEPKKGKKVDKKDAQKKGHAPDPDDSGEEEGGKGDIDALLGTKPKKK